MKIVKRQNIDTMIRSVKCELICVHGAPDALLADAAYDKPYFHHSLKQHNVQYKPRPSRRHNKLGAVEPKNGTIKTFIQRLDSDDTNEDAGTIVARAVFLFNIFSGPKKLRSF